MSMSSSSAGCKNCFALRRSGSALASSGDTFGHSAAPEAGSLAAGADTVPESFAGEGCLAAKAQAFCSNVRFCPRGRTGVGQGVSLGQLTPRHRLRIRSRKEAARACRPHSPIPGRGLPGWGPVSGAPFAREAKLIAERAR